MQRVCPLVACQQPELGCRAVTRGVAHEVTERPQRRIGDLDADFAPGTNPAHAASTLELGDLAAQVRLTEPGGRGEGAHAKRRLEQDAQDAEAAGRCKHPKPLCYRYQQGFGKDRGRGRVIHGHDHMII